MRRVLWGVLAGCFLVSACNMYQAESWLEDIPSYQSGEQGDENGGTPGCPGLRRLLGFC